MIPPDHLIFLLQFSLDIDRRARFYAVVHNSEDIPNY